MTLAEQCLLVGSVLTSRLALFFSFYELAVGSDKPTKKKKTLQIELDVCSAQG
jgi:hypothetical protein